MSNKYDVFAIVPNVQLHHHMMSSQLYIWSTKVLDTVRTDGWQLKTKKIGLHAAELQRGALLSNDLNQLEALCMKYGGVIQDIRTGEVLCLNRNGWGLETWTARGKPFHYGDILLYQGHSIVQGQYVRTEFKTDGHTTMNYVAHITDIPEVVILLGRHHYIP